MTLGRRFTLAALVSGYATLGFGATPAETAAKYLADAQAIVETLNTTTPDVQLIDANVTAMIDQIDPVIAAFSQMNSQCTEQLTQMLALRPEVNVWTAQEIRRNIEAGASLPKAEGCYAARDVVAHPAIVRALARAGIQDGQQTRLLREISEAIEHMEEIQATLGQE